MQRGFFDDRAPVVDITKVSPTGDPIIEPHFNGPAYDPTRDHARLTGQIQRIHALMSDGVWRTLPEIEAATGDPPASISAQLRHLRKRRFGAFVVERRLRGTSSGLYEYRVLDGLTSLHR